MNAPQRTPLAEPNVDLIPVDSIWPSRTQVQQLRRKRFNPDRITEIAASLLSVGQLQPIVVRPQPAIMIEGRKYELVLGERRWLAAQQAGLKHIEAKVSELDDAQVLEAQLIENLQREDLHPLEEAEGYRELMAAGDLKKEQLGERVGKSRSWVYSRLALLRMEPATREALESGQIDVSRALELAKIGDPVHQAKGLELASRKHGGDYVFSVRDLRNELGAGGFTISLKLAPFDVADRELIQERGSCEGCEFRSANNDPEATDPDVCTFRSCYEKKVKAHGALALKAAEEHGLPVLRGEAAKKITAGKDRYVGFVDLDTACDFDEFPEPEPQDGDDDKWNAWAEREQQWQPRTYRQLLALNNLAIETTLLEGKGKRVITLAPFKELQALLKKKADIKLPAHIATKPAPQKRFDYAAEQRKQEERNREQQERREKEQAWRLATLQACANALKPKPLSLDELEVAAKATFESWQAREGFKHLPADVRTKKTEANLIKLIRLAPAAECAIDTHRPPTALLALAKACKVDVAKIKKEAAAKDKPTTDKKGK